MTSCPCCRPTLRWRAQPTHVQILDPHRREIFRKLRFGEAGPAGARNRPDVHQKLDSFAAKRLQETSNRGTFVADRR